MSKPDNYEESGSARFRQKNLIAKRLGDELVLYDEKTNSAHCLNGVAGEMWMACEREGSTFEITQRLRPKLPRIQTNIVEASLRQMEAAGILEETTESQEFSPSRRDVIRKLGTASAAILPIVLISVLIPPAVAAASCRRLGQSCSDTQPCCPGLGLGCRLGICVTIP